jgi:pimeloyl-ACP methyl ester carboxylesterase
MLELTSNLPGLVITDHSFEAPLDHSVPDGPKIQVFGRVIQSAEDAEAGTQRPYLVFLQGGPGFCAPRPGSGSGWLGRALKQHTVVMLDERGTGRSTPVTARSLGRVGDAAAQASYLKHFRADSIVQDCELVREELLGKGSKWSVLGQSYGGFCAVHYLCAAPDSLEKVMLTGGIPPLEATAEQIYQRTFAACARRNREYYERYPADVQIVARIAGRLEQSPVLLPSGDQLSVQRFQTLGILLGASDGFEELHYLLDHAFAESGHGMGPAAGEYPAELSLIFLRGFENALNYDTNPIYSLLHEACYTQQFASKWSAQKVRGEWPEFEWQGAEHRGPECPALFLTGEMIFPWFFKQIGALKPLREVAELLAKDATWPVLYSKSRLAQNKVPVAAAVYTGDMYVDFELSKATAQHIRGIELWCTDEYEHNGLRADGEKVLGKLLELLKADGA